MRCKYCRTEYVGTKCPSCGSASSSKKDSIKSSSTEEVSNIISNSIVNSINQISTNDTTSYTNLIYKTKMVAYSIRFVFKTWIVCFILGLILSHYLKDGSIAFIEENSEILRYVKIALIYFGWLIGIVLMKLRRIIRRII